MPTTELMKAASQRMDEAAKKLREVSEFSFTPTALKEWLLALTDYVLAMGEVQSYSQESIHEKLQVLSRQLHRPLPTPRRRGDSSDAGAALGPSKTTGQ